MNNFIRNSSCHLFGIVQSFIDKESVDPGAGDTGASSDQGLATPVARGGHA